MTTYYCPNMEEALRRAKKAGHGRSKVVSPCGITLRSGRRGFTVYRDGKVVILIDFLLKFIVFQYIFLSLPYDHLISEFSNCRV
jgi:hypothetical protein